MVWGNWLDTIWNDAWELAREYYHANGSLLVPDSFMVGGFDLGKWIVYQRNRRKSGKLPSERVAKLEETGMVWDAAEAKWKLHYTQAKAYFEEHGNLDIPSTYRTEDGYKLGQWLARQRSAKKARGIGFILRKLTHLKTLLTSFDQKAAQARVFLDTFHDELEPEECLLLMLFSQRKMSIREKLVFCKWLTSLSRRVGFLLFW